MAGADYSCSFFKNGKKVHEDCIDIGGIKIYPVKQSHFEVYTQRGEVPHADVKKQIVQKYPQAFSKDGYYKDYFLNMELPMQLKFNGIVVDFYFDYTDNYYIYTRVVDKEGNVFTGFSGYGVGDGFEEGEYGYSSEDCKERMFDIWERFYKGDYDARRKEIR